MPKGSKVPIVVGVLGILSIVVMFMGGHKINVEMKKIKDARERLQEEFELSLVIDYELTEDGCISKVILKDNNGTSIIDGKEYVVTFIHVEEDLPRYNIDTREKLLNIYSSEYPSDKYK